MKPLSQRITTILVLQFIVLMFVIETTHGDAPATKPFASNEGSFDVTVMSFNIRNGKANDGKNAWAFRKDFVGDVIAESKSDIVGLQEAYRFQLDDIAERLPEYAELGEGRDGQQRGEYSAILYQKNQFEPQDSGTFWLSDTPDVKSRSWGNRYLRICTWARLRHLSTGRSFYVYNTHFDHQSQNARLNSAKLIAERISKRDEPSPIILTGDFNADEDNPVILYLKGENADPERSIKLVDTFRKIHPDETMVGTGGGFEGRKDGKKIDYVFVQSETIVKNATIVRTQRAGRFPSDHSPVTATIRFQSGP